MHIHSSNTHKTIESSKESSGEKCGQEGLLISHEAKAMSNQIEIEFTQLLNTEMASAPQSLQNSEYQDGHVRSDHVRCVGKRLGQGVHTVRKGQMTSMERTSPGFCITFNELRD